MSEKLLAKVAELQLLLDAAQTQQAANAAEVRAANERLHLMEAMLEIVPVGVVLANATGRITMGNSSVERMVGHPVLHSEDVNSYAEWHAFHADGRALESHEYPLSRVLRDGEDEAEIDVRYTRGDGEKRWMRIRGKPVMDAEANRIGAAVALIDIDAEKRLMTQQEVLIAELNHRVKNAFSVVKSIVNQSLRKGSVEAGLRQTIDQRLNAYASAHAKLTSSDWDHADVGAIARDVVVPIANGRVEITGPTVQLPTRQALALSMAFYELATNATKHGAWTVDGGLVDLTWSLMEADGETEQRLSVRWIERNGPKAVEPNETGFGSFLIDRALAMETDGNVDLIFGDEGFEWHLDMPVDTKE